METNGHGCVPIKVSLQKQTADGIRPGLRFLAPRSVWMESSIMKCQGSGDSGAYFFPLSLQAGSLGSSDSRALGKRTHAPGPPPGDGEEGQRVSSQGQPQARAANNYRKFTVLGSSQRLGLDNKHTLSLQLRSEAGIISRILLLERRLLIHREAVTCWKAAEPGPKSQVP